MIYLYTYKCAIGSYAVAVLYICSRQITISVGDFENCIQQIRLEFTQNKKYSFIRYLDKSR